MRRREPDGLLGRLRCHGLRFRAHMIHLLHFTLLGRFHLRIGPQTRHVARADPSHPTALNAQHVRGSPGVSHTSFSNCFASHGETLGGSRQPFKPNDHESALLPNAAENVSCSR